MVNTRNSQCHGQPSNNNNHNNNNNAHLEQLLTTQTQLMQAMLQTSTACNPISSKYPHLHYRTSLIWLSSCELAPPPSLKPKTTWMQRIGSRESRRNS
jgi:hypothetical protein